MIKTFFVFAFIWDVTSSTDKESHSRRLGWQKSVKKKEPGRPHAANSVLQAYSDSLSELTAAKRAGLVAEMLSPTSNTCTAHAGSPNQDKGNAFRWAFLVQTGGRRRELVQAQLAAFLSPYRRVVVSGDPLFASSIESGLGSFPPPVTQTWGGSYGQKILAGTQKI